MKELNQAVLEGVTEAANEAAAEFQAVLQLKFGRVPDERAHIDIVELLFEFGYHLQTGEWPGCERCGDDNGHPEYACPNSR